MEAPRTIHTRSFQTDADRSAHRYCSGYPQFSGRPDHLCIRTAGNENRNPCRCCHHHPQHPCGDFISLTHLSRDRIPHEGYKILLLSGLAEPAAGALAGWLILVPFMSDLVFGFLYAGVAGVMIFMSFDELLPSAREYGNHKFSIYGLVLGMAVMAVSLLML